MGFYTFRQKLCNESGNVRYCLMIDDGHNDDHDDVIMMVIMMIIKIMLQYC